MKKRGLLIALAMVLALAVLFFPVRLRLDGSGSVQYRSLTYRVTKVHSLIPEEEAEKEGKVKPYRDGIVVEILGAKLYDSVE